MTLEYRVTGLTALTTYTIEVAAMTAKGQGQVSASTISSGVPPGRCPGGVPCLLLLIGTPSGGPSSFRNVVWRPTELPCLGPCPQPSQSSSRVQASSRGSQKSSSLPPPTHPHLP